MPCKPDSTHFHGCECREEAFVQLLRGAKKALKVLSRIPDKDGNEIGTAEELREAIQQAEERCG